MASVALFLKLVLLFLESWRKFPSPKDEVEKDSPDSVANIFSISLFWWLIPLLHRGCRKTLQLDDLSRVQARYGPIRHISQASAQSEPVHSRASTLLLLARILGADALYPVLPRLALVGFSLAQVALVRAVLAVLSSSSGVSSDGTNYGLIGATLLTYTGVAVSTSWHGYLHERALTRLRGYLIENIYDQTIHMSTSSGETALSSTLLTVDVENIYNGFRSIHELWAVPVQFALGTWLCYREIGYPIFLAMIVVLFSSLAIAAVSSKAVQRQSMWMSAVQFRVSSTSAVLNEVKNLKLSGLSATIRGLLANARQEEVDCGSWFRFTMVISSSISHWSAILAPIIVFAASNSLSSQTAFTTLSYLTIITQPLVVFIQVLPLILASFVCAQRIVRFLSQPRHRDSRHMLEPCSRDASSCEEHSVHSPKVEIAASVRNMSLTWASCSEPILRNISLDFPASTLVAVMGPVGCGKTSLLQALLGEVPTTSGMVTVNARRVAYCSQRPFLFRGTIRENILCSLPYDRNWYEQILQATALERDISHLSCGDATRCETQGSLSGGQKQRVALARAVYYKPDILLVDDALSSLDTTTQEWLTLHVFGPKGILRRLGTTIVYTSSKMSKVALLADRCFFISDKGEINKPEQLHPDLLDQDGAENESLDGVMDQKATWDFGDGCSSTEKVTTTKEETASKEKAVAKVRVGSSAQVWLYYFGAVGRLSSLVFLCLVIAYGVTMIYPTVWVERWTSDYAARSHSSQYYLGVYSGLSISSLLVGLFLGLVAFVTFSRNAGITLHQKCLDTMLNATTQFMSRNSSGDILTYFAQDLTIIDTQLSGNLVNLAGALAMAVGQAILLVISSPWLAVSYPFVGAVLWVVRSYYVPTSMRLRVLDLEAKGPLVAHVIDTTLNLSTIRAFGMTVGEIDRNRSWTERSQRPSYLLGMAQQWILLVNNLIVTGLAVSLVSLALFLRLGSGVTGVGLITVITFSKNLADLFRAYTMVEIALGAIERLKSFAQNTPQEEGKSEIGALVDESWPAQGAIEIKSVSASYSEDSNKVLSNVDLRFLPGDHVGIYGRSGCGKSSLLMLLLGMLEPLPGSTGTVLVDDVDIKHVCKEKLRERVIAMPQDAIFLPGGTSVRLNLDPLGQSTDVTCRSALEAVGLGAALPRLDEALDSSKLSFGQQQLFCLARCIVRQRVRAEKPAHRGGLLLLDEVTAHLDKETAQEMNTIIKREFSHYTILNVTHKLHDASLFPKTVVMEQGRVVETGNTQELLSDNTSRFRALSDAAPM
ncbi:uncharacterized protein PgNI_06761 [Pyricularia grisea]|uniref:Uncharacterized protein n=1 Tax=Pyricularia grisea TaxID=148305 RepID=A0A6P8B1C5_PYRGI|nr:uncharacterized protein PgNI_06761 [Pyricularia grisea]TLD08634.1 hypothetical protein PgNI_06761 [Pyricularia grisea]